MYFPCSYVKSLRNKTGSFSVRKGLNQFQGVVHQYTACSGKYVHCLS